MEDLQGLQSLHPAAQVTVIIMVGLFFCIWVLAIFTNFFNKK